GLCQRSDLLQGAVNIGRVRRAHRLDADGSVAADGDGADVDLLGLAAVDHTVSVSAARCRRDTTSARDPGYRTNDVQVEKEQEEASEDADHGYGDRDEPLHVDLASADLLVSKNGEVPTVERRKRKQ